MSDQAEPLGHRVEALAAELSRLAAAADRSTDLGSLGPAVADICVAVRQMPSEQGRRFIAPLADLLARLDRLDQAMAGLDDDRPAAETP